LVSDIKLEPKEVAINTAISTNDLKQGKHLASVSDLQLQPKGVDIDDPIPDEVGQPIAQKEQTQDFNEPYQQLIDTKDNVIKKTAPHLGVNLLNNLDVISNILSTLMLDNMLKYQIGVAAGDDRMIDKKIWFKRFSSHSEQKRNLPFKNNQSGFLVGGDVQLQDGITIGISYAYSHSRGEFKNTIDNNDKERTKLHVATLYNMYEVSPSLSINTHLKYGKAFISAKRHVSNDGVANGKTTGSIFGARLEALHIINCLDKLFVLPKIGATFDRFKIKGFTETGSNSDATIPSQNGHRVSVNLGISLVKPIATKTINIAPAIHFNLDHVLAGTNKTAIINTGENGQSLITKGQKMEKNTYTVGCSVNMKKNNKLEFGIGYNYSFKPAFTNHSGYINMLVRF
jgi:outer membrane autotransporter protein